MCAPWPGGRDSQGPWHTGEVTVPRGPGLGPGDGRPVGRWDSVLLVASALAPLWQPDSLTPALRGGLRWESTAWDAAAAPGAQCRQPRQGVRGNTRRLCGEGGEQAGSPGVDPVASRNSCKERRGPWREAVDNGAGPRDTQAKATCCVHRGHKGLAGHHGEWARPCTRARVPSWSASLSAGLPPRRGQVNIWVCGPGA